MAGVNSHSLRWQEFLAEGHESVAACNPMPLCGHLTKVTGMVMEAVGLKLPIGSTCAIHLPNYIIEAEVVGFSGEKLFWNHSSKKVIAIIAQSARALPCHGRG